MAVRLLKLIPMSILNGSYVPKNVSNVNKSKKVKITTLSNGLKVASEDSFGQFCTVGGIFTFYNISYAQKCIFCSWIVHWLIRLI